MNMHRMKSLVTSAALVAFTLGGASTVAADQLDQAFKLGQARTAAAQKSQQKVDKIADETRDRVADYKQVLKQIEGLKVYIRRLDQQIADQTRRLEDIEEAIVQATVVQRQVPAVIEQMINALEEFVSMDYPFHIDSRQRNIDQVRDNLGRSDLTVAEKFRQVMELYKIENDYGRKISTYNDKLEIEPGVEREVTVLQIGRVALMYQTTDAEVSGAWDKEANAWTQLDSGQYKNAIRKAIRIAEGQAAKDILTVPVPAPEAVN